MASKKTKMVKRHTILNGEKLGFEYTWIKKMFKEENENDDVEQRKYVEQQNSERNKKVVLMRFDE